MSRRVSGDGCRNPVRQAPGPEPRAPGRSPSLGARASVHRRAAKSWYTWESSGGGGGGSGGGGGRSGGGGSGAWSLTEQRKFVYDGWNVIMELDGLNTGGTRGEGGTGRGGGTGVPPVVREYTWGLDLAGQNGAGATSGEGPVSGRSFSAAGLHAAGVTLDSIGLRQGQVGWTHAAGGNAGLLAAHDTNGTTTGEDPAADDLSYTYVFDANGNVGQLINPATGAVAASYEYDPYGSRINTTASGEYDQPFRFSTNSFDPQTGFIKVPR